MAARILRPLIVALALAGPAMAQSPAPAPTLRMAVTRFESIDVPPAVVAALAEMMTSLIDRPGVQLVERSQIERVMEEQRFAASDLAQPQAASETGKAANADCLLVGTIYRVDGSYVVAARLVNRSGVIRLEARGWTQFRTIDEMQSRVGELLRGMGLRREDVPTNFSLDHSLQLLEAPRPGVAGSVQDLLERPGSVRDGLRMRLAGDRRVLRSGERLALEITSERDGFLTLLVTDAAGRVALLAPNRFAPQVRIRAGQTLVVPKDLGFGLAASPPLGTTQLKAIVTDQPLQLPADAAQDGALMRVAMQQMLDASGSTGGDSRWSSVETNFLVVDERGQGPAEPLHTPPMPAPRSVDPPAAPPPPMPTVSPVPEPRSDAGPPEERIRAALLDLQRSNRPRLAAASEVLRWPLERPTSWPSEWVPASIGWTPLPPELAPPRIAVVDADFDPDDPALQRAFRAVDASARAALRDESRRQGDPLFRHGNRVASLIAGEAAWLPSTLPGAEVLPLRVTTTTPGPEWRLQRGDAAAVLAAVRRAAEAGCRVINLSLTLPLPPSERDAFAADPLWDELERRGVLVVCAAGNAGEDLDLPDAPCPAALRRPNVLCVGAAALDGSLATWNGGSSARGRSTVQLLAPGTRLAVSDGGCEPALCDGTSYACALASGTAAAWMALHPDWSPAQVIQAMVDASAPCPERGMVARGGLLRWPGASAAP